jgi:hypothetical protein
MLFQQQQQQQQQKQQQHLPVTEKNFGKDFTVFSRTSFL